MNTLRDAFLIKDAAGNLHDYSVGHDLDMQQLSHFFHEKAYTVHSLSRPHRHIVGSLEKDGARYFVKVATNKGVSIATEQEIVWNTLFAPQGKGAPFDVPHVIESGLYDGQYTYLITNFFEGTVLARPEKGADTQLLKNHISKVVEMALYIEQLHFSRDIIREDVNGNSHTERALAKVYAWYESIPQQVREKYGVQELLNIVEEHIGALPQAARHGDFTPWHIIQESSGRLALIDGEHALTGGVQHYDLAYMIHRVFTINQDTRIAQDIYQIALKKGAIKTSLTTMLAARTIGGFLDEALKPQERQDFTVQEICKEWVLNLALKIEKSGNAHARKTL